MNGHRYGLQSTNEDLHSQIMSHYTLGLDFGTNSVRALIVNTADGSEIGTGVVVYPSGEEGVLLDSREPHLARQHPPDYLSALRQAVSIAVEAAKKDVPGFEPKAIIGMGVTGTGSSPLPVDASNRSLAEQSTFANNPNAQCWLWKDHTSHAEAGKITEIARATRPHLIAKCGNTYSSEWFWSKIWHCREVDPEVFAAAHSWVELVDWVPSILAGVTDPVAIRRGVCAAGHKAFYSDEWGGLPDEEFLASLHPDLAPLRKRLYKQAFDASEAAGALSDEWAGNLGLPAGIPIAIGQMDVHYGAIGCGIGEGVLVKVIGTSTCDCAVVPASKAVEDIPGICGIVHGSILPGFYGIEAGQSAVGDIFKWWVEGVCRGSSDLHRTLTEEAGRLVPGESGLLALDWNNGNRTILVDQRLTGLVLGQTLGTTRAEIYRTLIEATAMGARMILERLEQYGVSVERIVCAGGIAEKNPLLMQIYADVTGREMRVARSGQACALGAAIAGAVQAGPASGGFPDFETAEKAMTGLKVDSYQPDPNARAVYDRLFELYRLLHDQFGGVGNAPLGGVMKELLKIQSEAKGISG